MILWIFRIYSSRAETESPELRKSRNSRQQLNALFCSCIRSTSNTNALIRRARRAVDADDLARAAALLTQVLEVFLVIQMLKK